MAGRGKRCSRRGWLKGIGAAAALAPFASLGGRARAQDALPKLLVFVSPNSWMVGWDGRDGGPDGWGPSGMSELGSSLEETALPDRLASIFEPLEPFGDRLTMIDNIRGLGLLPRDYPDWREASVGGHQHAVHLLTGRGVYGFEPAAASGGDGEFYSAGQSLDQFLAERWGTPVLGLSGRIAAGPNLGEGILSHHGPNRGHFPFTNPSDAFDAVYGIDVSDPVASARLERRRRVLGALADDAGAFARRASARDAALRAAHLQNVDAVRGSLAGAAEPTASCGRERPAFDYDAADDRNVPRLMRDYAEILTDALACGVTRVGYLSVGNTGGPMRTRWPELGIDQRVADHSWNHAFDGQFTRGDLAGFTQQDAWSFGVRTQQAYNAMFAYLLEQLDSTLDVDGRPLLDNTIVLHMKTMRDNHQSSRQFCVLAGGQNLGVRGARFIRARGTTNGRPDASADCQWYSDLHVGIAHALGETDVSSFGEPASNTTPIELV